MKKLLVLALIGVILGGVMVLVGCDLFGCPGGGTVSSKGSCKFTYGSGVYSQCTDRCITAQGTWVYDDVYIFSSSKSCDCN